MKESYRARCRRSISFAVLAAFAAAVPLAIAPALAGGARAQEAPPTATAHRSPPAATAVPRRREPGPLQTGSPAPSASALSPTATATPVAGASGTPTLSLVGTPNLPTEKSPVEHEERPIIVVRDFSVDPSRPAAGGSFTLHLRLKNVGEHFAENIRLSFTSSVFFPVSTGAMPVVNKLPEGDEKTVDVAMRVADGAADGAQALTISLSWDDSYGGTYSDATTIGIEVSASSSRPVVIVTAARLPGRVAPGVPFDLSLDLVNTGGLDARNLVVSLSGGSLAPLGGATGAPLLISPGATATTRMRVVAAALAAPGATSQAIELRYDGPDGQRYTESQTVGLVVSGDAAVAPLPIVASYIVDPPELHPGEEFMLHLTVANVGTADAQQARLVIGGTAAQAGAGTGATGSSSATTAGSPAFAPVGTGNVRFLDRLAAGESRIVDQALVVASAAKPGVYGLPVGLVYLDMFGNEVQDNQTVTLLVSRRIKLDINPVSVVTSTVVGRPVPFDLDIINPGTDSVNVGDVEIVTGRYITVSEGTQYIGPLDAGAPFSVSGPTLHPLAPTKDAVVTVKVHYTDDFGRDQTVERSFKLEIASAPAAVVSPTASRQGEGSRVTRILLGLLGLGASARNVPAAPTGSAAPAQAPAGGALVAPAAPSPPSPGSAGTTAVAATPSAPVGVTPSAPTASASGEP